MTTEAKSTAIRWTRDDDGVVTLTIDDPSSSANTMNTAYIESMEASVARLEAERETITGVILASAKKSFFAGGDLQMLREGSRDNVQEQTTRIERVKDHFRRLERLGRPVVAVIGGAALGGGLEVALAAHHRIVADVPGVQIGCPEVTLGLLPGAGGITRTVRMLGLQRALTEVILTGAKYRPKDALKVGLVDEVVDSVDELVPRAKAWIAASSLLVSPGGSRPSMRRLVAICASTSPCSAVGGSPPRSRSSSWSRVMEETGGGVRPAWPRAQAVCTNTCS